MATRRINKDDNPRLTSDPYAGSGDGSGFIAGGITNNAVYTPNSNSFTDMITNPPVFVFPEDSDVHIGDLSMSGKEFKLCMKMMREMAMEKYPEEFI